MNLSYQITDKTARQIQHLFMQTEAIQKHI